MPRRSSGFLRDDAARDQNRNRPGDGTRCRFRALFSGSGSRCTPVGRAVPYAVRLGARSPKQRTPRTADSRRCGAFSNQKSTGGGSRTHTAHKRQRILSPLRLPFRHSGTGALLLHRTATAPPGTRPPRGRTGRRRAGWTCVRSLPGRGCLGTRRPRGARCGTPASRSGRSCSPSRGL